MRRILTSLLHFLGTVGGTSTQKLVRGSIWVFTSYGVQQIVSLIRSVILARLLMPTDYGFIGIALLLMEALEIFTSTGIWAALIQRRGLDEDCLNTAWMISVFRGLLLGVAAALLAPVIAWFFEAPSVAPVIRVMAVTFFLKGANSLSLVLLEREMDYRTLTYFSLIVATVSAVAAVVAAFALRNVWAFVIGELAGVTAALLLSYAIHDFRPRLRLAWHSARELVHFGKYLTASGIVSYLTTDGDDAYVGKILGTEALGFYGMAYHLSNLPATTISYLLSRVTLPAYSALQDDLAGLRHLYLQTLRVAALLAMPVSGGMFVVAPYIIQVLYGSKWLPVVPAFMILCLFGLERAIGSLVASVFMALGKPRLLLYLSLTKLITMALGIVPLTARYGFVGTSAAVTISALAAQTAVLFVVSKELDTPIRAILKQMSMPMFGTLCLMAAVWGVRQASAWPVNAGSLLILVLIGALVYAAVMIPTQRDLIRQIKEILTSGASLPEYHDA